MFHFLLILTLLTTFQPESAVTWILAQQQEDGGWTDGFDPRKSSPGLTADAVFALWAAGKNINNLKNNPVLVLEDFASLNRSTLSVGLASKFILITPVIDRDPTDFDGVNLVEIVSNKLAESSTYEYCLALVAFYVTDTPISENGFTRLQEGVNPDGGWGFTDDKSSDTNTTAVCIQAAVAYGVDIAPALNYLQTVQNDDGGWPFENPSDFSTETDAFSTALVIMALNAAGENLAEWNNPQETLLQFQREDGAFNLTPAGTDNFQLLATLQAVPALMGKSLLDLRQRA